MIKEFFFVVLGIGLLVALTSLHYMTHHTHFLGTIPSAVAKVTNISSASFSVAYYEPRVSVLDTTSHPAYPQMQTINKMDLIYAK